MASGGNGTAGHVFGELFKMMAGVDLVHVPYRGSAPAIAGLLSGQVQVFFSPSIVCIRSDKLRVLAVTTASRSEALSNTPTVGDSVPGYEASGWEGVGAPKNTPADTIDKLNEGLNAGFANPQQGAPYESRECTDADVARRVWRIHGRRNREVGQGHPNGRHQGAVGSAVRLNSIDSAERTALMPQTSRY
jgi:tripartite-type tricarboxylate transporter receptor subunit TctC